MAQPYVGEIRLFAGSFEPNGWRFCDGQLLPISEYETLFNVIGTTYGGDGQETFKLPDLCGRVPVHQGRGEGLSVTNVLGDAAGVEEVTLTVSQIPSHGHPVLASTGGGSIPNPRGNLLASPPVMSSFVRTAPSTDLPPATVQGVGGSQPHDNRMPTLAISYVISLFGIFPSP